MIDKVKQSNDVTIILIALMLSAITIAITDIYVPALPAISHHLHASLKYVQLTIGVYLFSFALSHLFYGPLSDRVGRKPALLIGLLIGSFGSLIATLSLNVFMLLFARLIQGFGFGAGFLLARAILRDQFKGYALTKASAYMGMATSLAVGLAPPLGALIQTFISWRACFLFIFIAMILTGGYVWKCMPETNNALQQETFSIIKIIKDFFKPLSSIIFWGYASSAGLTFSGLIVYATKAPFILETQMRLTPTEFGAISIFIAIAQMLSFQMNVRILKFFKIKFAIHIGILLMFLGGVVEFILISFHIINPLTVIFAILFFTLGTGFIYTNAYTETFGRFKINLGILSAAYGLVQMMWAALTNIVMASLPNKGLGSIGLSFVFIAVGIMIFTGLAKTASNKHAV